MFETTAFFVNPKNIHETRPSTSASSISEFKSYTTLPVDPVKSGHPLEHVSTVDLGAPGPMVIVDFRWLSTMMFTHPMWTVLFLFCQTRGTPWMALGGTRLKLLTIRSPYDILPVFWNPTFDGIKMISITFYDFPVSGTCGLSFFEGFSLWYVLSDLRLVTNHISETAPIPWNDLWIY